MKPYQEAIAWSFTTRVGQVAAVGAGVALLAMTRCWSVPAIGVAVACDALSARRAMRR